MSELARLYHEATGFGSGRPPRPSVPGFIPSDPANRPVPFKRYSGAPVLGLPTDLPPGGAPAVAALSGRVPPAGNGVDLEFLARLLFLSAGVTRWAEVQEQAVWFRTAPSAGNRHPVEVYVAAGAVAGLETGLYHFAPDVFGLEELSTGDHRPALADAAAAPEVAADPLVLVLTGVPWRTAWKYGERGWRHVYWDAGTMLANLLTVTEAYGMRAQVLLGFVDSALSRRLGIDGIAEFPIAVVTIGGPGEPTPTGEQPAPHLAASPPAPAPLELPLITEVQRAGQLATTGQVTAWRAAAPAGTRGADTVEPPANAPDETIDSLILRRGSTRRMRPDLVPPELLEWGMAVAGRPLPADALPSGATLLSHRLTVHAVRGLEAGLYDRTGGRSEPYRTASEASVRRLSRYLCRDQALGGDAAFTDYVFTDLDRVLDAYGDRGYRVAQLEAGVAAGRLQLAAFALGYGGTGLTFTDDDVAAAFGGRGACMLAVSVGIPAYQARPGGPPGRPTRLDRVVTSRRA
ncbi:SagB family peptide dehydrogenase [Actinoallomurus rhizosphaericola]|uniref:SagB family peptide dehydrogenase n=1 Tax=Actinoallomurus rhizosphaericola TaxID=2952536 RepID=UPI00209339FA|nr:SagB family peptide dehydrogenase [Actinoallomurus rhizosphaericola]MCO5994822.1 SagB family peptide dehydrogenase [Actinoallomurus rhizosphaericola]